MALEQENQVMQQDKPAAADSAATATVATKTAATETAAKGVVTETAGLATDATRETVVITEVAAPATSRADGLASDTTDADTADEGEGVTGADLSYMVSAVMGEDNDTAAWQQVSLITPGEKAEELSDILFYLGAAAVTYMDVKDDPILEPLPGEVKMWPTTQVIGLFAKGTSHPQPHTQKRGRVSVCRVLSSGTHWAD